MYYRLIDMSGYPSSKSLQTTQVTPFNIGNSFALPIIQKPKVKAEHRFVINLPVSRLPLFSPSLRGGR